MKNAKLIAGVILIAAAVAGFAFWESGGRARVYETKIVVAAADIMPGDIITTENVAVKGVSKDDVMTGAVPADMSASLEGRKALQYIPAGGQISEDFLEDENDIVLKDGESIYCIDEGMIEMVSSSLRRGDRVHIYADSGSEDLGSYTVAFVKDEADREVKNASVLKNDKPLERENSNYTIRSIEIICTLEAYTKICGYTSDDEKTLTIVQEAG